MQLDRCSYSDCCGFHLTSCLLTHEPNPLDAIRFHHSHEELTATLSAQALRWSARCFCFTVSVIDGFYLARSRRPSVCVHVHPTNMKPACVFVLKETDSWPQGCHWQTHRHTYKHTQALTYTETMRPDSQKRKKQSRRLTRVSSTPTGKRRNSTGMRLIFEEQKEKV